MDVVLPAHAPHVDEADEAESGKYHSKRFQSTSDAGWLGGLVCACALLMTSRE